MTCRILVLIMVAGVLSFPCVSSAIESGPSNTVGYWRFDVQHGFNHISFPLLPNDKSLDMVIGDQLTGATNAAQSDQILRWDASSAQFQTAWFNTNTNLWAGQFSELSEAESYWIYVQEDHPAIQSIVAYGNVIEVPTYSMGQMNPGYNAVGSVWAATSPIATSGLDEFEGGMYLFLSDLILSYNAASNSYSYAWKDGSDEWQGGLTDFVPLAGYWIYVAPGHTGFDWNIFPQPNPESLDSRHEPIIFPKFDGLKHMKMPPVPTERIVKSSGAKGGSQ